MYRKIGDVKKSTLCNYVYPVYIFKSYKIYFKI